MKKQKESKFPVLMRLMLALAAAGLFQLVARAQSLDVDPQLRAYIEEALSNNPDLGSWRARVDAAQLRVAQAGAWPDPMVTVGLMNLPVNTFDFNQEAMTGAWINLSQSLPVNGQYGIRREMAEQERGVVAQNLQDRELVIARDVAKAWFDWAYWRIAAATTDTTIELLDDLIRISLKRYETGKGLQSDVLKLQTEKAIWEDRKAHFAQVSVASGRELAALIGRDPAGLPDAPRGLPNSFAVLDRDALKEQMLTENPRLKAAESGIRLSREKVTLNRRLWWPDLKLGVGYGYRQETDEGIDRPDFFTVTAGLTLPVFSARRQSAAVQEARTSLHQSETEKQSLELQLRLELENLIDEDERLAEQIRLYNGSILPRAEETLSAVLASYSVGRVDVDALVRAQTALLNVRIERAQRLRDRAVNRANLVALVGGDPSIQTHHKRR